MSWTFVPDEFYTKQTRNCSLQITLIQFLIVNQSGSIAIVRFENVQPLIDIFEHFVELMNINRTGVLAVKHCWNFLQKNRGNFSFHFNLRWLSLVKGNFDTYKLAVGSICPKSFDLFRFVRLAGVLLALFSPNDLYQPRWTYVRHLDSLPACLKKPIYLQYK